MFGFTCYNNYNDIIDYRRFINSSDCGGTSGGTCSHSYHHPTGTTSPQDSVDCQVCNILITIVLCGSSIMCFYFRTRNTELVDLQTHNIDDQSGIYEVIDKEWREEAFSEIKSPSNTYAVISQSKVEGLTMTQCPAYAPVTSLTINCRR